MPDTQLYRFFLDLGPNQEGKFLFFVKLEPQLRPKVGDSITQPLSFNNFRIMRDEINTLELRLVRVTSNGDRRVTSSGDIRITQTGSDPATVSHDYFILPANNPNRISTWTTSRFGNNQTLKQLFS